MKWTLAILASIVLSPSVFATTLRCKVNDPCAGHKHFGACLEETLIGVEGKMDVFDEYSQLIRSYEYGFSNEGNAEDRDGLLYIENKYGHYEGYVIVPYGPDQDEENVLFRVRCERE